MIQPVQNHSSSNQPNVHVAVLQINPRDDMPEALQVKLAACLHLACSEILKHAITLRDFHAVGKVETSDLEQIRREAELSFVHIFETVLHSSAAPPMPQNVHAAVLRRVAEFTLEHTPH